MYFSSKTSACGKPLTAKRFFEPPKNACGNNPLQLYNLGSKIFFYYSISFTIILYIAFFVSQNTKQVRTPSCKHFLGNKIRKYNIRRYGQCLISLRKIMFARSAYYSDVTQISFEEKSYGHVYFVSIGPKIAKIFEKFAAIKSLLNLHFKGFGAITRSGFC